MHIAEKYASLARDAMSSGDSVAAENYLQHAEHYNRIILAAQAQNPGMPGMPGMDQPGMNGAGRFNQAEPFHRDFDGDGDGDGDEGEAEEFVPRQRNYPERPPPYNPHQPQPFIPQNAFPHAQPPLQPATPIANGTAPHSVENFGNQAEGGNGRRRRRRPIGDMQGKGFDARNGGQRTQPTNGGVAPTVGPASEPPVDEAGS